MLKRNKIGFEIWHATLLGICFGACFPLLGYVIFLKENNLDFSWMNILLIHRESNLFFIIDLAPFVLGTLFMVLGKFAKYQLEYLKDINDLERSMRDASYDASYKYSLRKIRISYLYTFLISFAVLSVALVGLITNYFSDTKETALRNKIEALYANPDWLGDDNLEKNIFSHADWSEGLRYPALVPEIQRINTIRNLPMEMRRNALDKGFVHMNRNTIAIQQKKSTMLLVSSGIALLIIVTLMILLHFYVFAPNFIYLQKAINENTISKYVIQKQSNELETAKQAIQSHLEEIQTNLLMAQHIHVITQNKQPDLHEYFEQALHVNLPLHSLSGDFFWYREVDENKVIVILGDCIGHGVAGMMVSNLYVQLLSEICSENPCPEQIIQLLDARVRAYLHNSRGLDELTCDMAVLLVDTLTGSCSYAGAYIDLLLVSDQTQVIKAERFSLGSLKYQPKPLVHNFIIKKGDWISLHSDGLKNTMSQENLRLGAIKANALILNTIEANNSTIDMEGAFIQSIEQTNPNDDISIVAIQF